MAFGFGLKEGLRSCDHQWYLKTVSLNLLSDRPLRSRPESGGWSGVSADHRSLRAWGRMISNDSIECKADEITAPGPARAA